MSHSPDLYPKLHNAMWPGLVGKGSPGAEPCLDLDTMLDLTAAAEVDGVRFEGVDIFLFEPHIKIDITDDDLARIADKITARGFVVGSVVAPIWAPTGGGSAMGTAEERSNFVGQVRKGCRIAARLRDLGARPYGVVRIDSAASPTDWLADPENNTRLIAQTFREACDVAEGYGERLAAEGEICWAALHSWREMVTLLELVDRPETLGFQADMAHTLLYTLGYNAPESRLLPTGFTWDQTEVFQDALRALTAALRPWTIDFHVAQNDATVKGSGSHDKTGHHCLPNDPNGKLDIARDAGHWLRDENGQLTKAFQHICWDGCMFSNAVMQNPRTWNDILGAMVAVRNAHGWVEEKAPARSAPAKRRQQPLAPVLDSITARYLDAQLELADKTRTAKSTRKKVKTTKRASAKTAPKRKPAKKLPAKATKKATRKTPAKKAKKSVKKATKKVVRKPARKVTRRATQSRTTRPGKKAAPKKATKPVRKK